MTHPDDELVEKVAGAMFQAIPEEHWFREHLTAEPSRIMARAAIAVCMEEAAKKADWYVIDPHDECFGVAEGIAAAIRSLSPKVR